MSKVPIFVLFLVLLVACSSLNTKVSVPEVAVPSEVVKEEVQIPETNEQSEQVETPVEQEVTDVIPPEPSINETQSEATQSNTTAQPNVGILINQTQIQNVSAVIQNKTISAENKKQIQSFGDSLTYGEGVSDKSKVWIALINPNAENYAVSGATTSDVLNQLKNLKPNTEVFLWVGSNDAAQLVDLQTFESNYRLIVQTITSKSNLTILNIPDATKLEIADQAQEQLNNYLKSKYGIAIDAKPLVRQYGQLFNNIIQKVANEHSVKVIDMFNFMETFDSSLITADGFHPNEKGHQLIANYVKEQT